MGTTGSLSLTVAAWKTVTVYPYTPPNRAPTIMTWTATPGNLVLPASTTRLSARATDPELDPLTYQWSVVREPVAAHAQLAAPNAPSTDARGLVVAGTYVFRITVRDGGNTSSRDVYLAVRDSNQAPLIGITGFRIPAPYGYVMDYPEAAPAHANISLPTTSFILSARVSDLEHDALSGDWTIETQPAGATATLAKTFFVYGSFRTTVTGLTVPGDYVFRIAVKDPTHLPVTRHVTATVHPPNMAPVITAMTAAPLSSTRTAIRLAAATADADGDLLRYWLVVKAAPAGAHPVFSRQGWRASRTSPTCWRLARIRSPCAPSTTFT